LLFSLFSGGRKDLPRVFVREAFVEQDEEYCGDGEDAEGEGTLMQYVGRPSDEGDDEADESAAEVGVMANFSALRFDAVDGYGEEEDGKEPGGDGNGQGKDVDAASGQEEDGGVDDAADAAGCAEGAVVTIVAVDGEGEEVAADDAGYVDDEQGGQAVEALDGAPEGVERKHVEGEVNPIGVEEAGGDHSVVFLALEDGLRLKEVAVEEAGITKSLIGENAGADDDQEG